MTNKIKNDTLTVKEGKEAMATKKLEKTKDELREFANSEEVYEIIKLREYTGLSQRRFSEKYGIPRRTVEDWERGMGSAGDSWVLKLLNRVVKEDIKNDLRYNRI